jgi:glycosyltransferase involved in cell wall biosynthesis
MAEHPRLLLVCDAVAPTGWARVGHALADRLNGFYDIHYLGINYFGNPHDYPYPIYPAFLGGDPLGVRRFRALADQVRPDVTLIIQDVWIVGQYLQQKRPGERYVCYPPVDAVNQAHACDLNDADLTVFYTQFGLETCRADGFMGDACIVPHGIDRTVFQPGDRVMARLQLGMSQTDAEHAFVVGAVNRNQPRKRLDLLMQACGLALRQWPHDAPPFSLLLHTNPRDPLGYDLIQLRDVYGLQGHLLFPTIGDDGPQTGTTASVIDDAHLALLYQAMDVHVSTSIAEGWGLTTAESLACGVPNILPEHSALAEWPRPGAFYVPAPHVSTTPGLINTLGRVCDASAVADALLTLAQAPALRSHLRQGGVALMQEPRFHWDTIAGQFHYLLEGLCMGEKPEVLVETLELAEPLPLSHPQGQEVLA